MDTIKNRFAEVKIDYINLNYTAMTKRNLSVMGNALVNTFKFTANATMAMLFVAFLTACSSEDLNHHPTSASKLMGSMNEANGLGWATVDVEANATDINGEAIYAEASVRYECAKEVFVESEEELGLPVTATGDGTTFTINDGNIITRTESHSASNGVTLNVAGGEWKGGTLGERIENGDTIRQEVLSNLSDAAFATANNLPESFAKEWRDSKTSVVKYYRVYVKPAAPVYEAQYRLRVEFIENDGNCSYWKAFGEKSTDGGVNWTIVERVDEFCALTCGNLKPQINGAKLVTSYAFTANEEVKPLETMQPRKNEGTGRTMEIHNTVANDNIWGDTFGAPADANGNTELLISGAQALRIYEPVWHNPETGEEIRLATPFTGEVVTTANKVDESGILTITREVRLNGQMVNSETATVQLELQ